MADDHESHTLDFKQDARSEREMQNVLAKAAVCFANADGGTLVLGVKERTSGEAAIVGTEHALDWCRQRIHDLTT